MVQHLSIIGVIATDPKMITSKKGLPFCTFRLASTDRRLDATSGEWVDVNTNWYTVNAYRTLGTHAHESFKKGERVVVVGRLRVRDWSTEEKQGTNVEINADGIGHDVRWGVTTFDKRVQASAASGSVQGDEPDVEPAMEASGVASEQLPPFVPTDGRDDARAAA